MTIQSKRSIVTLMLPENIHKHNIDFLTQTSQRELTDWLLRGGSLSPIYYKDERSAPLLLQNTLQDKTLLAHPKIIEKVNSAVCDAISEWQPNIHANEIIDDLAYLSALTRNARAVPALIHLVDNHSIPSIPDNHAESVLVAVISGFAPEDTRAEQTFHRWWNDNQFNWQYKAIIFNGLLECDHDNISELLPSFLSLLTKHQDYFRMDILTAEAARIIGPDALEKALQPFNNWAASQFKLYLPEVRKPLSDFENQ